MTDRGETLIVGAGYTGMRVAHSLREAGADVATLNRKTPSDPLAGVDAIVADLDHPEDLSERLANLGEPLTLIYLVPPTEISADADPQESEDTRLRDLLNALPHPPTRVVLASTSGVYGDRQGRVADERTELAPLSDRARARVAAEATLARLTDAEQTSTCILRIAGIYGPERLSLARIRDGAPMIIDVDAGPGNRIHVDDLVQTIVAAATAANPPPVVNVCDGDHSSSTTFAIEVARQAQLPLPPMISLERAQKEFSVRRLSFLNESRRLLNARLLDELGVQLLYPKHRAGVRASLAQMGMLDA